MRNVKIRFYLCMTIGTAALNLRYSRVTDYGYYKCNVSFTGFINAIITLFG